ncbi:hypothetical protein SAMN04487943_108186 [Gracilibacillus orientalis]|uniref:Carbohydrate deacetylase n=1 Tax=Gracilibacillus orientalis TaxID=334253 RepID=A0A1I4NGB5_9BACI|nr:chitin disaccharide deacetylase [Gracilibacillus orientalis]SFM14445.1 hypothetical protein SAMN04487943_108186 [Gracilibacillus orientalis]
MEILFNADDFGLTEGVSEGIVKAHKKGVVSSTTLMMNGKATRYAVALAKRTPTLKVGIHLTLTWGKPLHPNVSSLIDAQGYFKFTNQFRNFNLPDLNDVKKEWKAQIEGFLQTGLALHHIDSHHHIHGWEPLKEVVIQLATEYKVPVRYTDSLKDQPEILLTNSLWLGFYSEGIYNDIFKQLKHKNQQSIEVMTHPGFADLDLVNVSSYTATREEEIKILCQLDPPSWVKIL